MSVKTTGNTIEKGVDLLLKRNKKLPAELRERADALSWELCEDNSISSGIDKYGMPFFIEVLTSSADYVEQRAPEFSALTLEQRQIFAEKVENHSKTCARCVLKIKQDSLLEDEIDTAFEDYRNSIKESNNNGNKEGSETVPIVETTGVG